MSTWAERVATTITKHFKGAEPAIMRNRPFSAMLYSKGRILYNCAGTDFDWRVEYKRRTGQPIADMQEAAFARQQRHLKASLGYKAYIISDVMSKMDMLANKGPEAIASMLGNNVKSIEDDLKEDFDTQLLINGDAAGYEDRVTGFESIFKGSGTGTQAVPNTSTYAGLSLVRGNYGGNWTGTWPYGRGDAHFDFWSPLIVNYTSSSGWTQGATFAVSGDEVLRWAITASGRNSTKDGQLDMILLDLALFNDLKNLLATKERFVATDQSEIAKLGFTQNRINFEGVDVLGGYGLEGSIGYGISVSALELLSMQSQLFYVDGPKYDFKTRTSPMTIDFMGNLRVRKPRNQIKFVANG